MRIVLCPPTHFQIRYAINPWMDVTNQVDSSRAWQQYRRLAATYEQLGAELLVLEPDPGHPDMVFTANHGAVVGDRFIPAIFAHPERHGEAALTAQFFTRLGFTITPLTSSVRFEGQGDLLWVGDRYFLGYGPRTDRDVVPLLTPLLDSTIEPLALIDPAFYHLDTCFAPLTGTAVLINPGAFTTDGRAAIKRHFTTVIETKGSENTTLPCNLVRLGTHTVVGAGLSTRLRSAIEALGLTIHEVEMSEFRKSGGSVKCLTLLLDEQSTQRNSRSRKALSSAGVMR